MSKSKRKAVSDDEDEANKSDDGEARRPSKKSKKDGSKRKRAALESEMGKLKTNLDTNLRGEGDYEKAKTSLTKIANLFSGEDETLPDMTSLFWHCVRAGNSASCKFLSTHMKDPWPELGGLGEEREGTRMGAADLHAYLTERPEGNLVVSLSAEVATIIYQHIGGKAAIRADPQPMETIRTMLGEALCTDRNMKLVEFLVNDLDARPNLSAFVRVMTSGNVDRIKYLIDVNEKADEKDQAIVGVPEMVAFFLTKPSVRTFETVLNLFPHVNLEQVLRQCKLLQSIDVLTSSMARKHRSALLRRLKDMITQKE